MFKKPNTTVTSYIDKPGWFHVVATHREINPVVDNTVKDQINVTVSVLGGTDASQVKRISTLRLQNPNEGHKDGGEFAAAVQCRLAIACDVPVIIVNEAGERVYCPIADVPEGVDMDIDWVGPEGGPDFLIGKQFIIKMHEEEYQGKKSIKLDGRHIYHVTDEMVKDVPKDAASLKAGGYKVEAPKAAPAKEPAKANGNGNGSTTKPATSSSSAAAAKPAPVKPAAVGAGAYDDL